MPFSKYVGQISSFVIVKWPDEFVEMKNINDDIFRIEHYTPIPLCVFVHEANDDVQFTYLLWSC